MMPPNGNIFSADPHNSMKMRLLNTGSSAWAVRARMALYAKGEPLEARVELVAPGGPVYRPNYKILHQFGRAPTLWVGDMVIQESIAIAEYFDDVCPTPPLKPEDPLARAKMRMLCQIADSSIMAHLTPLLPNRDPNLRPAAIIAHAIARIHDGFDRLEYYIENGRYAVGDNLTLADCVIVPTLWTVLEFLPRYDTPSPFDGRTKCTRYWQAIQEDKIVQRILPEMEGHLKAVRAARIAAETGKPTIVD
jgi:glutathione S-transferase